MDTSTTNVKSQSQFRQVVKSKMLASYSNAVHCGNLHCTDCHGQSVYSNYVEDHLVLSIRCCVRYPGPSSSSSVLRFQPVSADYPQVTELLSYLEFMFM